MYFFLILFIEAFRLGDFFNVNEPSFGGKSPREWNKYHPSPLGTKPLIFSKIFTKIMRVLGKGYNIDGNRKRKE